MGIIHERFEFEGPAGGRIRADVRAPGAPAPRAALILVHGFKGFKEWGFLPYVAERLARAGYAAVTFDFSRNGVGDGGEIMELEVFATNTYSIELAELHCVTDRVAAGAWTPGTPKAIGLLGYSRGGADAILSAREDPRIRALVTWAAVASVDRWDEATRQEWRAAGRIFVLNHRTGQQMPVNVSLLEDLEANRERLDVLRAASEITVPWLIVHGEDDTSVLSRDAEALAARARRSVARLELLAATGHTFGVMHPFAATTAALEQAVALTLRHFDDHLRAS
ncbi:MAG: alpha/beta fold hydrolase [Gemmatimonadetes bacterium]|nr:alpha/beta fold hydrolase [Gemmatimonadota bacterium]